MDSTLERLKYLSRRGAMLDIAKLIQDSYSLELTYKQAFKMIEKKVEEELRK